MAAKYRKIDPRIWNDEKFLSLSIQEKLVVFYILTAQVNRIGLFVFSPAMGAEACGMKLPDFNRVCDRVFHTLSWAYDKQRRVVYLPSWWKYNPCESTKTMKGYLEDIHDIPQTPLLQLFKENGTYLSDRVFDVIRQGMAYPMGYPMPYQEQEQEQEQEHEQEQDIPPKSPVTIDDLTIPQALDTPDVRQAVADWLAYKRSRGQGYKQPGHLERKLAEFVPLGEAALVEAVNHCIGSNYDGLFPLKGNSNGRSAHRRTANVAGPGQRYRGP